MNISEPEYMLGEASGWTVSLFIEKYYILGDKKQTVERYQGKNEKNRGAEHDSNQSKK